MSGTLGGGDFITLENPVVQTPPFIPTQEHMWSKTYRGAEEAEEQRWRRYWNCMEGSQLVFGGEMLRWFSYRHRKCSPERWKEWELSLASQMQMVGEVKKDWWCRGRVLSHQDQGENAKSSEVVGPIGANNQYQPKPPAPPPKINNGRLYLLLLWQGLSSKQALCIRMSQVLSQVQAEEL